MLDVLLRENIHQSLNAVVGEIFGSATEPQHFQFLVKQRCVGFFPFRAIARSAKCADLRKVVEVMQADDQRLRGAHRQSGNSAAVAIGQHSILTFHQRANRAN